MCILPASINTMKYKVFQELFKSDWDTCTKENNIYIFIIVLAIISFILGLVSLCMCLFIIIGTQFFFWQQLYRTELEKAEYFSNFSDFCNTFELSRGKDEEEEDNNNVGEFKVSTMTVHTPKKKSRNNIQNTFVSEGYRCWRRLYLSRITWGAS